MTASSHALIPEPDSPTSRLPRLALLAIATGPCASGVVSATEVANASITSLKALSIEQLLDMEVTSVSRQPEKLLEAPAAIQVLTSEDIRRSGASNIPTALRLANNLDVAQKSAHEWVISARGFSSDVGNKLLVLIDGRSVYTPLFSGVFWDRQDYLLEDIDRIEIISGPGGALWGANAVNGVINITTKGAQDTQGLFMEGGAGTNPRGLTGFRYGGALGDDNHFRVYGKYSNRDSEALPNGTEAHDAWQTRQGGFRIDLQPGTPQSFTLQGDMYRNTEDIVTGRTATVKGGNLLGRWSKTPSDKSEMSLQLYYDRAELTLPTEPILFAPAGVFGDTLDTYDLDFQHRFPWGERHSLAWGFGYRFMHDKVENSPGLAFFPTTLGQSLYSGFVRDEIALPSRLTLTLGTKVEHTDYTGFEVEPNLRLQWAATEQQALWAAISRAVRTPSRIDRDFSYPAPQYLIVALKGDQQFDSEKLLAYEAGYRAQLHSRFNTSLSTFYNVYDDIRSTTVSGADPLFHLFPFYFENNLEGTTWGFELAATLQALERWRLHGEYRLLKEDIRIKPGKTDFNNALNETSDPEQQWLLRSSLNLPLNMELDADLRHVGTRRVNDAGIARSVPRYTELGVRLGWRATERLELSLVGQNLLDDQHPEYGKPGASRVEIERSIYARVAWRH